MMRTFFTRHIILICAMVSVQREIDMKYIRILLLSLFIMPFAAHAASSEFMVAAQLLSAAKNADIQQVQLLINNGADVNFVDSSGMSIVCTALMNNDVRAAQILQMYGADASKCDRQIRNYKSKNTTRGSGGLFGGLSSAQSMTLAAAGAAVVVGGLLLLTDVLDPGNDNSNANTGGSHNTGGNTGGNTSGATAAGKTAVGPAFFTSDGKVNYTTAAYNTNLEQWNPSAGGVKKWDFNYFRLKIGTEDNPDNYKDAGGITVAMQNYLLMMHGYSSFANGYLGQTTFRDTANNPQKAAYEGKPVLVSLITENGINPSGSADRGEGIVYGLTAATDAQTARTDKYLNYDNPTSENSTVVLGAEKGGFDLSGSGTAMNPFASANQNALAKIIGGWNGSARSTGDLYGFVPNGQLAVLRTGGGYKWTDVADPTSGTVMGTVTKGTGSATDQMEIGDTITIDGKTYKLSLATTGTTENNTTITVGGKKFNLSAASKLLRGACTSSNADDCTNVSDIAIYVGTDGYYYVNTTGGNRPDAVYVVKNNNIYTQKEYKAADIQNYSAMLLARTHGAAAIANAALNPKSRSVSYLTMDGLNVAFNLNSGTDKKTVFANMVNKYYGADSSTVEGAAANTLFGMYNTTLPIIVNPAGEFEFGLGDGKSPTVLDATFENYAPLLYGNNLQRMFMTVVAVGHTNGTSAADTIGGYGNGTGSSYGPLYLSTWSDTRGTPETTDDVMYQSRKCGVAGSGTGGSGIDPWCFAAAGPTTEMATAAAAGAVAAVQGAFPYMTNDKLFTLLALTADGAYLGSTDSGTSMTKANLVSYLRAMYSLPPEYNDKIGTADEYLAAFKDVYGYGLINLERALTPNKQLYYYNSGKIVGTNGNAYWRAASNTTFRTSSAFSPRMATISAPFFDKLESVDGEMAMPRIWKNEFAVGAQSRRGLYMGDVLGDLRVRDVAAPRTQIGNLGFSMTTSNRAWADNLGGLDTMRFDYDTGNWNFAAGYQRYMTDGASRFGGMANPILGLASNAVATDVEYGAGNWAFGARAFSGAITSEKLLDNDPTISSQYAPARLGLISGVQSHAKWHHGAFEMTTAIGSANETNTILGAQTGGLLDMGAGHTTYIDSEFAYRPTNELAFKLRGTFARTTSDMTGGDFILGMSDIYSDAFGFEMNAGHFTLGLSRPLGVLRGTMQYSYADYDIIDTAEGRYDIGVSDAGVRDIDLRPDAREYRISGAYRHALGAFTDGAIGFIYRINPNHTDAFGNEFIFMLKLNHRLGI